MIWTLFFALVILLILGTLLWARGIRYRKGLHIHMKLGDSEVTPVLSESGHTMFDIGGKTGMLLRGENGVVQISYGDSDEDLRWLRGYRYGEGAPKLRVVGTTMTNRMPYRRFMILMIAALLVAAFIGFGIFRITRVGKLLGRALTSEVQHSASADVIEDKDITSILIAVTGEDGAPDMIKTAVFNKRSKSVKLLTLLGDTQVSHGGRLCRLAEVPGQELSAAVEDTFSIKVDETLILDDKAFVKVIDSLGGVTVEMSKAEAEQVNTILTARYGEDCTLLDTARLFSGKEENRKVRCDGKQAYCLTAVTSTGAKPDNDYVRTEREDRVINAVATRRSLSKLLLSTSRFSEAADGTATSLSTGDLLKLGFDTASYWRDYRDSYRSAGSIRLPVTCQELYSTDGTRTLYTYPAQLRQAVIRIICYDMKG
ncbi:MAG: LCP family protein [Ruminococcus sp.]|nr:LCP family protein [Ruminococcus sp.]